MPSDPTEAPLRVLVKGASTIPWISWMGGTRADMAFPRVIETELWRRGIPTEVRTAATLGRPTPEFIDDWETDVLTWSPDVVVLVAGHYEVIHFLAPHWYERHANRLDRRATGLRGFYYRRLARAGWKPLIRVQSWIDGPLITRLLTRRLRRMARETASYIEKVRLVGQPMVQVLELLPPAGTFGAWFPGVPDRVAIANDLLHDVVEQFDSPDVTQVPIRPLADSLSSELAEVIPDGFHYTPAMHRLVGAELADRIELWIKRSRQ